MKKFDIIARVYYEDTDAGGIVYHANYLKFMERARTEWVRSLGIDQQKLLEQSLAFVVIDMQIAFKQSAVLDDLICITCEVVNIKRASLEFAQTITRDNKVLVSAAVKVACVNTRISRPVGIPAPLLDAINIGSVQ